MSGMFDLGGVFGDAMLDDIFSGEDGVGTMLTTMFGGPAKIIFMGKKGSYDRQSGKWVGDETTSFYRVAWADDRDRYNNGRKTHINGVRVESKDVVGLIKADDITKMMNPGVDKVEVGGKTYNIIAVESLSSGQNSAAYRVLGRI